MFLVTKGRHWVLSFVGPALVVVFVKSGFGLDYEMGTPGDCLCFKYFLKNVFFQAVLDSLLEWL